MIDQHLKTFSALLLVFLLLSSALFMLDYGLLSGTLPEIPPLFHKPILKAYANFLEHEQQFRLLHLILVASLSLMPATATARQKRNPSLVVILLASGFSILFLYGYTAYQVYNFYLFPLIFFGLFLTVPFAIPNLKTDAKSAKIGLNKRSQKNSWSLKVNGGRSLTIYNPRQATFIEGRPGAGKSELIYQIIDQMCRLNFAGVIYDYEGDFTEEGGGILTNTTYSLLKKHRPGIKFAYLNFTDISRTVRVNLFSSHYISDETDAREIATNILYNLNPEWNDPRSKAYWKDNAITVFWAAIVFFKRNHNDLCTYPHVCEFLLNPFKLVLEIMNRDSEVRKMLSSVNSAFDSEDAGGQQAGIESSIKTPLLKGRLKKLYYVLNPSPEEEFNLDITNKENPVLLSIGNSPRLRSVLAPAISVVLQLCINNMNRLGKQQSVFLVDETPTVYINDLDKIISEARKKGVCSVLAVQTRKQLERTYGKDTAGIIIDGCGNQFVGFSSTDSGKQMSDAFGKYYKQEVTRSQNLKGRSESVSQRKTELIDSDEIAFQEIGHFTGIIAGGKPPRFSAQFDCLTFKMEELPPFSHTDQPDELIEQNYLAIQKDVENLINRYANGN